MIPGLKLKRDASGGKTMHDGDYILVGCMKSLKVLSCSRIFCKAWSFSCSENFSALVSAISKDGEGDLLINLPLFVRDERRMQC